MSNEPTIAEMNFAIGIFDGRSFSGSHISDYAATSAPKMKYHSSWDWLMKVVGKIEKLENGRFGFTIDPWGIDIIDYKGAYDGYGEKVIVNVNREPLESELINDYYNAVCQFVQWYNKQQSNEQSTKGNY